MKVIGIGDNVIDVYVNESIYYPGGNALNFSVFAKKLGYDSAYLGIFGTDEAGKYVKSIAEELEIDISHSRVKKGENGQAFVEVVDGDRKFIRSNRGGIARTNPLKFKEVDIQYIKSFDLIVTSINSHIDSELYKLKDTDVPLAYDFSTAKDEERLNNVCPYIDYAIISLGEVKENEAIKEINRFHQAGAKYVLATQGDIGARFSDGEKTYFVKSNYVTPVDTMGAGDSFFTAFLINLIKNKDSKNKSKLINESLEKAAKFSAETCLIKGSYGFGKKITREKEQG